MLIAKCRGGIGNRMKNMWGAARLDQNFKVYWVYKDWIIKNSKSHFSD